MREKEVRKKTILFVYTGFSTFVKNDFEILASAHLVEKYKFEPVKGLQKNALEFAKQFLYLLVFGWKFDLFYCWFADYHSFLPVLFAKIFRKKAVVVIGGYDVCRIRKLDYGAFCSPFRGWFCAGSMRMASSILPVSGYVDRKARAIAPHVKRTLIYNCVTLAKPFETTLPKRDTVLTVGLISNERTFYLKGIDTFIETSRLLPSVKFEIVGINASKLVPLLVNLPTNLSLYDRAKPAELIEFYQRSKIYCQLSRSESFGVSIAEAMTFGNFPVVTNEGGMPEVAGTVGAVVRRDPEAIASLVSKCFSEEGFPDQKLMQRQVDKHFTNQLRSESLLNAISG